MNKKYEGLTDTSTNTGLKDTQADVLLICCWASLKEVSTHLHCSCEEATCLHLHIRAKQRSQDM
jgi:hypothetical protein